MPDAAVSISVCITAYNQAPFVAATIESVLAQTRAPDEIVLVDDGSTDGTADAVKRFGARVRLVQQRNRGVAEARNRVVREARGDVVALLDGDDLWLPHKLERCARIIRDVPATQILVHDIETMSADATEVLAVAPVAAAMAFHNLAPAPARQECWKALVDGNFIWTTTQVLMRRSLYMELGLSDPRFKVGSDYDLYLRAAERTPFVLVPEILARWRRHDASASGSGYHRRVSWTTESVHVLQVRAARADPSRAVALRRTADMALRLSIQEVLRREPEDGSWTTTRRLAHMAFRCRSARAAIIGASTLMPRSIRRVVSAAVKSKPW